MLEAGGVVATGMIVPEASDTRPDDWRVAGDVGDRMFVGLPGGLSVTAGLLGPSPKPSRRPPNRPRGGRGGNKSFCAAQSCSCGESESNVSSARGCNAASCVMRPALRFFLRLPPGSQLTVNGCMLELLLCCLSSSVILRQLLPKTLCKIGKPYYLCDSLRIVKGLSLDVGSFKKHASTYRSCHDTVFQY